MAQLNCLNCALKCCNIFNECANSLSECNSSESYSQMLLCNENNCVYGCCRDAFHCGLRAECYHDFHLIMSICILFGGLWLAFIMSLLFELAIIKKFRKPEKSEFTRQMSNRLTHLFKLTLKDDHREDENDDADMPGEMSPSPLGREDGYFSRKISFSSNSKSKFLRKISGDSTFSIMEQIRKNKTIIEEKNSKGKETKMFDQNHENEEKEINLQ